MGRKRGTFHSVLFSPFAANSRAKKNIRKRKKQLNNVDLSKNPARQFAITKPLNEKEKRP